MTKLTYSLWLTGVLSFGAGVAFTGTAYEWQQLYRPPFACPRPAAAVLSPLVCAHRQLTRPVVCS